MQAIGFAVAGESDVAVPGDDALRKVAPPMAKGVQIEIAGDRTVYLPVYDARWLAGELRRGSNGRPDSPLMTAADLLERSAERQDESRVAFHAAQRGAVARHLREHEASLSEPLRDLRDELLRQPKAQPPAS